MLNQKRAISSKRRAFVYPFRNVIESVMQNDFVRKRLRFFHWDGGVVGVPDVDAQLLPPFARDLFGDEAEGVAEIFDARMSGRFACGERMQAREMRAVPPQTNSRPLPFLGANQRREMGVEEEGSLNSATIWATHFHEMGSETSRFAPSLCRVFHCSSSIARWGAGGIGKSIC